jgi:hypothetical protein
VKTNDLISLLVEDTSERWSFGRALAFALIGGVLIAGAIFSFGVQVRPDFAYAIGTVRFCFKFVVTVSLAVTATGLVRTMARPGVPAGFWRWAAFTAPALLLAAVIVELVVMPQSTWIDRLIGDNSRMCMTLIPLMAIGPLICLLLALRQGAPRHPGAAGAVAGLIVSGIAATFYASRCTDDSPLFVVTWYPLAAGLVVLIGYLAGSKMLRW